MPHDITSLRYAVIAADTRSFARAATAMRVKQATLSRRIAWLEARIGLTLFERSTRGAIPTKAGDAFIEVARRIIADLDHLIADSHAIGSGTVGTLALGFSTSLSAGNMRATIADLVIRHPDIRVVGIENNRNRLSHALHAQMVDFAVVSGDLPDRGLQRKPLWSERVVVALPQNHFLIDKERIYWSDLREESFVQTSQDPGPDLAELLRGRLGEPGWRPAIAMHDMSRDNVINMVGLEQFVTLTTEAAIGSTYPGVVFRDVREPSGQAFHIDYSGYWRPENASAMLARFLKLIRERYPG